MLTEWGVQRRTELVKCLEIAVCSVNFGFIFWAKKTLNMKVLFVYTVHSVS